MFDCLCMSCRWCVTYAIVDTDAPTIEASWGSQRTNTFEYVYEGEWTCYVSLSYCNMLH